MIIDVEKNTRAAKEKLPIPKGFIEKILLAFMQHKHVASCLSLVKLFHSKQNKNLYLLHLMQALQ